MTQWLDGGSPVGVRAGRASARTGDGTVFVFPGQGAQHAGMGRELFKSCRAFRGAVTECDEALRRWLGRSVIDAIREPEDGEPLEGIDLIQPALFAIAVGIAARCRAFGIEPDAVVGHSMGEVAASYVAGALSLDDAARVICSRSTLLRKISGQGAMLIAALPVPEAERLIEGWRDRVSVAVSNSPTSTVLSGDPAALAEVAGNLAAGNVFSRHVKVDVAAHSPQVDALAESLLDQLAGIAPRRGTIPILSTVTGELCDGSAFDAGYWVRNLRQPVLFWDAVRSLIGLGHGAFVEMSPHPTLLSAVEQAFEAACRDGVALASMRRDVPEGDGIAEIYAGLHVVGRTVPLGALLPGRVRFARPPRYTWQRERLWFRSPDVLPAAAAPGPRREAASGPEAVLRAGREDGPEAALPFEAIDELVRSAVAGVLTMDPDRIDPMDGFFQLGMDSMLAVQARVRIETALGRKLPATVMFEHPTVFALAGYLTATAAGAQVTPLPLPPAHHDPPIHHDPPVHHDPPNQHDRPPADELSEEELLNALAAELGPSQEGDQ